MTFLTTYPTARAIHRCEGCCRLILPGEQYVRQFETDYRGTVKWCAHCDRCVLAYMRQGGDSEFDWECIHEWLSDEHQKTWVSLRAHWRYPDGEILPLPFQPRCISCGAHLSTWGLWCVQCDEIRITRLNGQFTTLFAHGNGGNR